MIGISTRSNSLAVSLQRTLPKIVYDLTSGTLPAGVAILRSTSGTYFNASGQIATKAANQARFDHDPVTGAFRGLLIEGSRANTALYSAANASNWVPNGAVLANLSATVLGLFAGLNVVGTGATWHRGTTAVRLIANTPQTVTVYYRSGTSGALRFALSGDAGLITIQGTSGALTVSNVDFGAISNLTQTVLKDGLTHRLRFTFTSAASGTYQIGGGPRSSVSGQTVEIYAIQVEAGSTPSSYIPSVSTEGSRDGDRISLPLLTGTNKLLLEYEDGQTAEYSGVMGPAPILATPPAGRLLRITATPQ